MFITVRWLRHGKEISYVKGDEHGEIWQKDHGRSEKTSATQRREGETGKNQKQMNSQQGKLREYREIEVLRRIVFELSVIELETIQNEFHDDQEASDYISWLLRRRELF